MSLSLFHRRGGLHDFLEIRKRQAVTAVDSIDANTLLSTSDHDLCRAFVEEFKVQLPVLNREAMQASDEEADIPFVGRRPGVSHAKGTRVTVTIPFTGDEQLFHLRPSHFNLAPPQAEVRPSGLLLTFDTVTHDPDEIARQLEGQISSIEWYLGNAKEQVDRFHPELERVVGSAVIARRKRLLDQRGMMERLGIPIRRREDAPTTYAVPVRRKRALIEQLPKPSRPFQPEPALLEDEYQHILHVIECMAHVMERSPTAFRTMSESDLRMHFPVQLNAQYEGEAAGEVFNFAGKTDILLRHQDRNVFIAECKFWRGPAALTEALDQLLSYLTWRDARTAIILFNRGRDFSKLLSNIPQVVEAHRSFKRRCEQADETRFRFVLGRPDDPAREVILTVLAFDMPRADESANDRP